MQYRMMGQTGKRISTLAYGMMRMPRNGRQIDEVRTERQVLSAIDRGVNYFDTAFVYDNGRSETILGNILSKGRRQDVMIATKIPPYLVNSRKDMDAILETQLKRLQTDHIDFYLFHALKDQNNWQRMMDLGAHGFIEDAKRAGKLGHVGFSFHGEAQEFIKLTDAYPWEFCQIQYNYMDTEYQAGRSGLHYAAAKGMGVTVMEPLRGGMLAGRVPAEVERLWDMAEVRRTPAEWALRWLWDQPEITSVLSGMNEESHIEENIRIASESVSGCMVERERELVNSVQQTYRKVMKVGCTGCGYCMPCPGGVNIPTCFAQYNAQHLFQDNRIKFQYAFFVSGLDGRPPSGADRCTGCGKCEKACPQNLPIRQELKNVARDMDSVSNRLLFGAMKGYLQLRKRFKANERK